MQNRRHRFDATHHRHFHVHDDDVRAQCVQTFERRSAIDRGAHALQRRVLTVLSEVLDKAGKADEAKEVRAKLDKRSYVVGKSVSNTAMKQLRIRTSRFRGDWNYEVCANEKDR